MAEESKPRPDKDDTVRSEYDFRESVIISQMMQSNDFGRHLGAVFVGQGLADYDKPHVIDQVDERLDQISQDLVQAVKPVSVGQETQTPELAFGQPVDPVDAGVFANPLPEIVGQLGFEDYSPQSQPQVKAPEVEKMPGMPYQIPEEIVGDLPEFARPGAVQQVSLPERPSQLDNPLQETAPFINQDGSLKSIDEHQQSLPWLKASGISDDLTMGVAPPPPTPQEQATGSFIVGREPEPFWDDPGVTVDVPWTAGQRKLYDERMAVSDTVNDYEHNLMEFMSTFVSSFMALANQFQTLRDALASETEDYQ